MKGPGIKDDLEVNESMKVTACEREPKPCNDANLLPGDLQADAGRR